MLNILREKSKIFLWIVAVSFIGFMVAVWGMDLRRSERAQSMGTVGQVNGARITVDQYREAIRTLLESYRRENKDQDPPDDVEREFADQAWQTLVERAVLTQEVNRRRIRVTDAEIVSYIRSNPVAGFRENPAFLTNGQFDIEKYRQALNDPRIDWSWLEDYVRGILPFEKLRQEVAATVGVSESEVRERFLAEQEKVKVSYLAVLIRDFRDTTTAVTDAEIEALYNEKKETFRRPEQAVLSYVLFERKPSPEDEEDARQRAVEVAQEARAGTDFAELARVHSEDPGTAPNGGDLGFFAKGTMVPEFEQAAFSLAPGQVSDPIKSTFGYHVIRVEETRRNDAGQEEVHARHILFKVEPGSDTVARLQERATALIESAREEGFEQAAQAEGLTPTRTLPFGKGDFIPGIGLLRRANVFAFANDKGAVSPMIDGPRGYYVFSLVDRTPERVPPLDEVRDAVREQVRLERQRKAARARAEEILAAIRGGASLEEAAARFGLEKRETGPFMRLTTVAGIGRETPFTFAAFALQPGQTSGVVELNSGCYILRVDERHPADEALYASRQIDLRRALLNEKLNARFSEFVNDLIAKADVKDLRGRVEEG